MRGVATCLVTGLTAQFGLLTVLASTVGLDGPGWIAGTAYGVIMNAALARGLAHHDADRPGPADWVTLTRATLIGGVLALIADSFGRSIAVPVLVALAAVALVLDAVDGWLARRTATTSALGARFDMEVDAFLILVLSVYVARTAGAWVLAIGLARYVFVAGSWLVPWLRDSPPPRYWCKVVAATQGVVLTLAAADILPLSMTDAALGVSLGLLTESFGREAWWLWRHQRVLPGTEPAAPKRLPVASRRPATAEIGE